MRGRATEAKRGVDKLSRPCFNGGMDTASRLGRSTNQADYDDALWAHYEAQVSSLVLVTNRHGVDTLHNTGCPQLQFAPSVRRFIRRDVLGLLACGTCSPSIALAQSQCTPYRNELGFGWTHRDSRGRFHRAPRQQAAVVVWFEQDGTSHGRGDCREIRYHGGEVVGAETPGGWLCGTCVEVEVMPPVAWTINHDNHGTRECLGSCGEVLPIQAFPKHKNPTMGRKYVCRSCRGEGVDGRAYAERAEQLQAQRESDFNPSQQRRVRGLRETYVTQAQAEQVVRGAVGVAS